MTEIVVLSGDVPLVTVAPRHDPARPATRGAAPWSRWRPWTRSIPTVSVASCGTPQARVERVVEERDATEEQLDLTEINAGLYAFDVAWLRRRLPDIPPRR